MARSRFQNRRHLHKGFPSTTEVLGLYQDWSAVSDDVLEQAAERGTKVHEICACIARGVPYLKDIPPECAGYVLSFQNWFEAVVEEVVLVEERLYDEEWGYTGRLDFVFRLKGDEGLTLLDIKTASQEQRTWRAQVSSYRRLAEKADHGPICRAGSLRLHKMGGRAKLAESDDGPRDLAAFMNALSAYRYLVIGG